MVCPTKATSEQSRSLAVDLAAGRKTLKSQTWAPVFGSRPMHVTSNDFLPFGDLTVRGPEDRWHAVTANQLTAALDPHRLELSNCQRRAGLPNPDKHYAAYKALRIGRTLARTSSLVEKQSTDTAKPVAIDQQTSEKWPRPREFVRFAYTTYPSAEPRPGWAWPGAIPRCQLSDNSQTQQSNCITTEYHSHYPAKSNQECFVEAAKSRRRHRQRMLATRLDADNSKKLQSQTVKELVDALPSIPGSQTSVDACLREHILSVEERFQLRTPPLQTVVSLQHRLPETANCQRWKPSQETSSAFDFVPVKEMKQTAYRVSGNRLLAIVRANC